MALVFVFRQRTLDLVGVLVLCFYILRNHVNCRLQDQSFLRAELSFTHIAAKPHAPINAGRRQSLECAFILGVFFAYGRPLLIRFGKELS